jgi:hypothetical protein
MDGLSERLYDKEFVRQFFDWWLALYEHDRSALSPIEKMIGTMEALVFESVIPGGFRMGTRKPDFRLICQRQHRLSNKDSELTTIIKGFILKKIISEKDRQRLASRGIVLPSYEWQPWSDRAIMALIKLPDADRKISLKVGRTIGGLGRLVWFTRRKDLGKVLLNCTKYADQTRDSLGLAHHKSGEILIALHFSGKALQHVKNGRPTFSDAGEHKRFKTHADKASNRKRRAWGHCVDLSHLLANKHDVDGLPERIAYPINKKALVGSPKISFTPLGKVIDSRGDDTNDDDSCFANRLLNRRNVSTIRRDILNII